MSEKPEQILAESLIESPLYGAQVQAFADEAWRETVGHNSRCHRLARKLQGWMRERNPIPDDGPPLELLFFSMAIDTFNWWCVAEYIAEELGMPEKVYPKPKARLR